MRVGPRMRAAVGAVAAIGLGACRGHGGRPAEQACRPVAGTLGAAARAAALAGEYRVTLVATTGPRKGESVEGRLWLHAQDSALRDVVGPGGAVSPGAAMPLVGGTDVALEEVGALRLGDPAGSDPSSPGIAVLESRSADAVGITLRVGSEANRRGVVRFDGGYTALRVQATSAERFDGSWASGITATEAEGYFCAVRTGG